MDIAGLLSPFIHMVATSKSSIAKEMIDYILMPPRSWNSWYWHTNFCSVFGAKSNLNYWISWHGDFTAGFATKNSSKLNIIGLSRWLFVHLDWIAGLLSTTLVELFRHSSPTRDGGRTIPMSQCRSFCPSSLGLGGRTIPMSQCIVASKSLANQKKAKISVRSQSKSKKSKSFVRPLLG